MIELLHPSIKPVSHKAPSFFDKFENYLESAEKVVITSGYLSEDALLFFTENIEALPSIEFAVGMHHFDGFTRAQYQSLMNLSNALHEKNKGQVYIAKAFPFHGKVYTFWKENTPVRSIVGSSNFSCVTPRKRRIFEVDVAINEQETLKNIAALQKDVIKKACINALDYTNPKLNCDYAPVRELSEVVDLDENATKSYWSLMKEDGPYFKIPLKCTSKSNLNVYFGKGRENTKTKFVRPRPWYEVEVIVGKDITSKEGYPRYQEFEVITDDGYRFWCNTNGDYAKNFRSKNGLSVLGAWIKGRMEQAGVLEIGDFITEEILQKYGRNHISLIATTDPKLWLLDFGVER